MTKLVHAPTHNAIVAIVEDDQSVREATGGLLKSVGYSVLDFSSAESFFASDRVGEVACIITDVRMPGMGGIELQRKLIADGCRTPVIIVTAFPERGIRERALAAGAHAFLTKPYREESLIECLWSALE